MFREDWWCILKRFFTFFQASGEQKVANLKKPKGMNGATGLYAGEQDAVEELFSFATQLSAETHDNTNGVFFKKVPI